MYIGLKKANEDGVYFILPTLVYVDGEFEGYTHTIGLVWINRQLLIQW